MTRSNSRILVGITQRVDHITSRNEFRDALDRRLVEWLLQAGYLSTPIPNVLIKIKTKERSIDETILKQWLETVKISALILSGGNDIGESPERDATERYLLSWAKLESIPVLGICRGLQMMTAVAGGKLVRIDNHVRTRHKIIHAKDSDNLPRIVNSYHSWGIDSIPDEYEILATSDDGRIEAIKHKEMRWEGWMWHPEREATFSLKELERIRMLFNEK